MRKSIIATVVALTAACTLSACSTNDGSTEPKSATAAPTKASDLKIAYFHAGTGNTYLQAGTEGAEETTKEIGASLQIFDGKFDAQTQFNQVQTALTSGKFNAFIVEPNDGKQLCEIFKTAIEQKILVVTAGGTLCGRDTEQGDGVYQPGTVAFVGGQTAGVYESWVERVKADYPNGGKFAALTGPQVNANTVNMNNALKKAFNDPKWEVVAQQATDYTAAKGYSAAQTILRANPDLDAILANYSGMTQGVVKAVTEAGKTAEVRVYDIGGNEWAVKAVADGQLAVTAMLAPKTEMIESVKALQKAAEGTPGPTFVDLSKLSLFPGTSLADPTNITKFHAEY